MGPVAQLEVREICNHNFPEDWSWKNFLGHFLPTADSSRAVSRSVWL